MMVMMQLNQKEINIPGGHIHYETYNLLVVKFVPRMLVDKHKASTSNKQFTHTA